MTKQEEIEFEEFIKVIEGFQTEFELFIIKYEKEITAALLANYYVNFNFTEDSYF